MTRFDETTSRLDLLGASGRFGFGPVHIGDLPPVVRERVRVVPTISWENGCRRIRWILISYPALIFKDGCTHELAVFLFKAPENRTMKSASDTTRQPKDRPPVRTVGREETCYLYLAVHTTGERFKIGLSNDPLRRFEALPEATDIDLKETVARRLPSRVRASEVERSLHRALAPFRIELEEQGDGYTEWFRLDAFARARVIIDAMPDATAPAARVVPYAKASRSAAYRHAGAHNVLQTMGAVAKTGQRSRSSASWPTPGREGATFASTYKTGAALRTVPGGERLVPLLRVGIEMIRIEPKFGARRPALSPETITAGLRRLLEHGEDDPSSAASRWG